MSEVAGKGIIGPPPTFASKRGEGYGVKGSKHVVFWPSGSRDLGILMGMLYGDGHVCPRSDGVRTGHWRIDFCEGDADALKTYFSLTKSVFNIEPSIRVRGNWSEIYFVSRIVYEFYTRVPQRPEGKKTGKLAIPEIAKLSRDIMNGFICGLFSVEGSAKVTRYVRLSIEMLEPRLIKELFVYFESQALRTHINQYKKDKKVMHGLYRYGPKDISFFLDNFGLIGRNQKKLVSFLSAR